MKKLITLLFLATFFIACNDDKENEDQGIQTVKTNSVKTIAYNIIAQYPHDTASYTEGLEIYDGKLYESGGDFKNSFLQVGDLKTGKIDKTHKMGTDSIFGEGITILNGKIYQLTWRTHDVYVYDVKDVTKNVEYLLYDEYDTTTQTPSMSRTTGYACNAFANLIINKKFDKKGVFPPELVGNDEGCFEFVMNYLKKRGVEYKKS